MEELLRDALRYDYGPTGSRFFFEECYSRLQAITGFAKTLTDFNRKEIRFYARELSHLSRLIAQIERSHIGEFPWAFGESLKKLAERLCADRDLDKGTQIKKAGHPLFFIMAEGGLSAFEARKDSNRTRLCKRQVFTIVVPRSLKHHVLLHAVLGHEVCHAALWRSKLHEQLNVAGVSLGKITPLTNSQELLKWIGKACPKLEAQFKPTIEDVRRRWLQELLCDLFGLVFMGPAYFAAVRTMLGLSDPTGEHIDPSHPPHVWRYQMLEYAYRDLGWDNSLPKSVNNDTQVAALRFNTALFDYNHSAMCTDTVIRRDLVVSATKKLSKLLEDFGGFGYDKPEAKTLEHLLSDIQALRPPIGQTVKTGKIKFLRPDFRQILHVGWLACHTKVDKILPQDSKHDAFTTINRLCEQAIIQERAIRKSRIRRSGKKKGRDRAGA